MAQIIPNENSWIGFVEGQNAIADVNHPTSAEIASCTDLTDFTVSINAMAQGNTVPAPRLKSLFEPSVNGTSQAQFSASMYRDDESDDAWNLLPRGTVGFFVISRFGGTGTDNAPADGETCEVWPVTVTSRAADQLTSNTVETFALTCAVPVEPGEDAVVTG